MADQKYARQSYAKIVEDLRNIAVSRQFPAIDENGDPTGCTIPDNIRDFYRSSTGQMLAEWLAITTDITTHNVAHAFRESLLPLAKTRSGSIASAKSVGYVIRRPTPATTSYTAMVHGTVLAASGMFTIPARSSVTIGPKEFVTVDSVIWKWDASGYCQQTNKESSCKLVEGIIKKVSFYSDGSKKFAKYSIDDLGFSNMYGDRDPWYDEFNERMISGSISPGDDNRITKISVGGVPWSIDRRSLATNRKELLPKISNGKLIQSSNKKVLIQTANNGGVDLIFGDGIIAEIPFGWIEVEYLSTSGSIGSVNNIIDTEIDLGSSAILADNYMSRDNISCILTANAVGGDDMESVESIKYSAPSTFASLDREVNGSDHAAYLRNIPGVKHAIAYGEQDTYPGNFCKFNVITYSILKPIYVIDNRVYRPATSSEYCFDGATTEIITGRYYSEFINTRPDGNALELGSELDSINEDLSSRAQLTCEYLYTPPKVHKFKMSGNLTLRPGYSRAMAISNIQQKIYEYLLDNTKFKNTIHNSALSALAMSSDGVVGCSLNLSPYYTKSDVVVSTSYYFSILCAKFWSIVNRAGINIASDIPLPTDDVATKYKTICDDHIPVWEKTKTIYDQYTKVRYHDGVTEKMVDDFLKYIYNMTCGAVITATTSGNYDHNLAEIYTNDSVSSSLVKLPSHPYSVGSATTSELHDAFITWAADFRTYSNYYTAWNLTTGDSCNTDISDFSSSNEIAQIIIEETNISTSVDK